MLLHGYALCQSSRLAYIAASSYGYVVGGEDVEVLVAGLPELFAVALETLGGFSLEDSHGVAEESLLRFGEQQVGVLRHEDVAEEIEIVRLTDSL